MGLIALLVVGLIAGWLAGEVMKGSGYGVGGDIVIGIIGALVGGFLASAVLGVGDPLTGINIQTLVIAFLGSIVLIAVVRALPGRSPV